MPTRMRALPAAAGALTAAALPFALAAALAALVFFLGTRFAAYAEHEGRALASREFGALAERAVAAAERPIETAARTLSQLARAGPFACGEAALAEFRRVLVAAPSIANIGLVDLSGRLMCSAKGSDSPDALLAPLSPRAPIVALLADSRAGRSGLAVGWTPSSGPRLVAELAPDAPALPDLPAFAAGHAAIVVATAEGGVWRRRGAEASSLGADLESATTRGAAYPVVARVEWPKDFIPDNLARIASSLRYVAGGLAALAFLATAASWLAFRRRTPAGAPVSAEPPSYRAVIETDSGRLVGIDLAVADAEATAGIAVERLAQVLASAAPLLAEWPSLKLSFPISRSVVDRPAERERLTAILAAKTIEPDQLVATLDAGRNLRRLDALSALLRTLRRTGMQVGLTGPGENLRDLLKAKPDFLWLVDPLAGLTGKQRETGIARLRDLAEAADTANIGILARAIADPESLEDLRQLGIITATGPIFGSAMPAGAMAEIARAAALPAMDAEAAAG